MVEPVIFFLIIPSTLYLSKEHRWTAPCKGFYKMQRAWMPVLETLIKTY